MKVDQSAGLDTRIRAAVAPFEGRVSLFAKNLDTGATYGLEPDRRVSTASTIKVPIMVETFAQVAAGKHHWDDTLTLTHTDKKGGTGILFEFHDGLKLTLRDAVTLMIVLSDNTATNLVLDQIGTDAVNERMDALGLPHTRLLRKVFGGSETRAFSDPANKGFSLGVTTPHEMVTLLENLERGEVASPEASKEMIAILKREQRHDGIGRNLEDVPIASKSGALNQLRSNVGILYTKRGRIAMAITCDEIPRIDWTLDNPAYLLMSRLSDILIDGLGQPLAPKVP